MSTNSLTLGKETTRDPANRWMPSHDDPSGLLVGVPLTATAILAVLLFIYPPLKLLDCSSSAAGEGRWLIAVFSIFFALVMVLTGIRWCTCFAMAYMAYRRNLQPRSPVPHHWPRISILVPAYNEGETIEGALESLLQNDYPRYEVIVVDDGSSDDTFALARKFEGRHGNCTVRVHSKPNGGKWSALNFAFQCSTGEFILCVDADSRLGPGSMYRLAVRLSDPRVDAVAGQVQVRNQANVLTRLQALEYLMSNGLMRMAQSLSGTVLIIPGPIGLFRRGVLEEVFTRYGLSEVSNKAGHVAGPFEGDTFAEDSDLSLTILSLGRRIVYEPEAISYTKAPVTTFRLLNQRYRWQRGNIQVLRKFVRRVRSNPEMLSLRLIAWIAMTYLVELSFLPVANIIGVVFFVMSISSGVASSGVASSLLGWFLAFMLLNVNAAFFFASFHRHTQKVLLVLPFYDLYHDLMLNSCLFIAVLDEIRGVGMRW